MSLNHLEDLPQEKVLEIAAGLTADSLNQLIQSSSKFSWLRLEVSLWRSLAKRDRNYPESYFNVILEDFSSPQQAFNSICRCSGTVRIHPDDRNFRRRCLKPSLRNASFCTDHCKDQMIELCILCEKNVIDKATGDDSFCGQECKTRSKTEGCEYIYKIGAYRGKRCGAKRLENSTVCSNSRHWPKDKLHVDDSSSLDSSSDDGDLI